MPGPEQNPPSRGYVPAERASFIGRTGELALLAELVAAGAPLVTITGPGGTGKTRLAVRYAALHAADFPGCVWFVDLTSARSLLDIAREVGRVLGVPLLGLGTETDTVEHLGRAVNALGAALLVLDNLEQIVGEAAALVGRWLALAPEATFVVTSRERLRVSGEVLLTLEPLAVPARDADAERILDADAVRLFLDRARAAGAALPIADADADVLAEVVRRLDGLPLAIELCAPRARMLGLRPLLAVLASSLDAASLGCRGAPARSATLRGAIDWSWSLLDPDEKDALARCSVFRGGFDLDAAGAVFELDPMGGSNSALDLLQALHDKSLLRAVAPEGCPGDRRFDLLESVREFAAEKLREQGAAAIAEARHAAWYVIAGERLRAAVDAPEGDGALRRLALESENLLAAHERGHTPDVRIGALLALDPVFDGQGPLARYADLLLSALGAPLADRALEARARLALGLACLRSGRVPEGKRELEHAAAIANEHGASAVAAVAHANLGIAFVRAGELDRARAAFDDARREEHAAVSPRTTADVDNLEASFLSLLGSNDASLALHERALVAYRRLGCERGEAFARAAIGGRHVERGVLGAARTHLSAARTIYERYRAVRDLAYARHSLGVISLEEGDHTAARDHFLEALAASKQAGVPLREANALLWLGHLELESRRPEAARRLYDDAVMAFGVAFARGRGAALAADAAAAAMLGRAEEASVLFERAEEILHRVGHPADRQMVLLLRLHLVLMAATATERAGDGASALLLRRDVDAQIAACRAAGADGSDDTRFALRTLHGASERRELPGVTPSRTSTWTFSADGTRFQSPSGESVNLARRRALGSLLAALLRARLDTPGAALSAAELLSAGWPAQQMTHQLGLNRLRVATWTLRGLGLREILMSRDDGYFLDSTARIEFEPE
jgi:predicted ATPase